jgi:hypothetical protein
VTGDLLPILVGIALVAAAAAFALLPFVRGTRAAPATPETEAPDRFALYGQVLELEFDYQLGKLSAEDYRQLSAELLGEAGLALRQERGSLGEVEEEIEREIAAARTALAAAREKPGGDAPPGDGRSPTDGRSATALERRTPRRSRAARRRQDPSNTAGKRS